MFGGTEHCLWIGLTDRDQEGTFVWVTGDPLVYTNWGETEPNNAGEEDYACILNPSEPRQSRWNDYGDVPCCFSPVNGVVEVVPRPDLSIQLDASGQPPLTLTLSWPGGPGIKLQKAASLAHPDWQDVAGSDGVSQIELPRNEAAAFFRLLQP